MAGPSPLRSPPGGGPLRRWRSWAGDHGALLVLMALPFVAFGVPVLFGHAVLDGDNYLQNFPLRVLVARDLDHGTLPLWNPYLFSGTPLLAGFNAGAAYPATWVLALLPVFTAWALVLAASYDLALLGMYLFLRRLGLCRAAATFGAATFTFAGYMAAQIVHIDLIQGAVSLPWMLLAVHGLTERAARAGRVGTAPPVPTTGVRVRLAVVESRGGVALLAVSFASALLSGGVEAAIDSTVLVLLYWVGRLVSLGPRRRPTFATVATATVTLLLGLVGGAALGAAQWIPGAAFVAQSQRSGSSYTFFTSGSLPERLVTLLVSPFVLGTNQDHPVYYVGPYNFQEVTSYVGILALIAACVLVVRRWRTRPEARQWWIWYVVLAVGLLSAVGNQTPFGHLLYAVPGLNSQRLLNRNLLLVDCALAVLLAWWSHLLLTDRPPHGRPRSRPIRSRWQPGHRAELIAIVAPFGASVLLCAWLWAGGTLLDHALEATYPMDAAGRLKLAPLVTAGTLIAGVATGIVLWEARWSTRALRRLLAGVLAADLLLFDLFVIRPPISEDVAQAQTPAATAFQAAVGDGRFIVLDTDRFFADQLQAFGQTDLNVFTGVPSAQGYTALTDGTYYAATGAHLQEDLAPSKLTGPVWDDLNVSTLLSVPSYFVTPAPGAPPSGFPFPGDVLAGTAKRADGPFALSSDSARSWYFGGVLTLERWSFPIEGGATAPGRAGLLSPTGRVVWLPPSEVHRSGRGGAHLVEVVLPAPIAAGGVVVQAGPSGPMSVGAPTASTAEAGTVRLDGRMQAAVAGPRWAFSGALGAFGVFHNRRARGWAWLEGPGGGAAPPGSTVSAGPPGAQGAQPITVHATGPVLLDRSQTWATGWHATVVSRPPAGTGRSAPGVVTRAGLVQQVRLPGAGDYRVTFSYAPSEVTAGVVLSSVAVAALILWGLAELVVRRRSGTVRGRPGAGVSPG